MALFACDWCKAIKQGGDVWILGLAAESSGMTAALREINILAGWDEARACDRLAVHFCSVEHKEKYMAALYETEPLAETVIDAKATVASGHTAERMNRFRKLGFIHYNGGLQVHRSLHNVVLHD